LQYRSKLKISPFQSNYPQQYHGGPPPGGVFGANAAMAPYGGMPYGGGYGGGYSGKALDDLN
jgi:hypothetical protein